MKYITRVKILNQESYQNYITDFLEVPKSFQYYINSMLELLYDKEHIVESVQFIDTHNVAIIYKQTI